MKKLLLFSIIFMLSSPAAWGVECQEVDQSQCSPIDDNENDYSHGCGGLGTVTKFYKNSGASNRCVKINYCKRSDQTCATGYKYVIEPNYYLLGIGCTINLTGCECDCGGLLTSTNWTSIGAGIEKKSEYEGCSCESGMPTLGREHTSYRCKDDYYGNPTEGRADVCQPCPDGGRSTAGKNETIQTCEKEIPASEGGVDIQYYDDAGIFTISDDVWCAHD